MFPQYQGALKPEFEHRKRELVINYSDECKLFLLGHIQHQLLKKNKKLEFKRNLFSALYIMIYFNILCIAQTQVNLALRIKMAG